MGSPPNCKGETKEGVKVAVWINEKNCNVKIGDEVVKMPFDNDKPVMHSEMPGLIAYFLDRHQGKNNEE